MNAIRLRSSRSKIGISKCAMVVAGWLALSTFETSTSAEETLSIVGWNAEANFNGADPTVIAERMAFMEGVDIWGFCEVKNSAWAQELEHGAEVGESANFDHILGTTGGNIRLLIIFDADRLERLSNEELHDVNEGNHRAPLIAKFRIRLTSVEFLIMVNHLARGNASLRHEQATKLREWATDQTLPVIAVGDYNFDWHYRHGESDHDQGYDNLTAGSVFTWIRPPILVRTQASSYDGVLDFVFVANKPATWKASSRILREPGDFPDSKSTSDHRPVSATIEIE